MSAWQPDPVPGVAQPDPYRVLHDIARTLSGAGLTVTDDPARREVDRLRGILREVRRVAASDSPWSYKDTRIATLTAGVGE